MKNETNATKPKQIAVLFGGRSPEYTVSLQSAYAIITHMDREKFAPTPIGITPSGEWFLFRGHPDRIPNDTWYKEEDCVPVTLSLSPRGLYLQDSVRQNTCDSLRHPKIDAVFPVLHGRNGEDGTVQGMFRLAGIPVVGCDVLASALCMDKDKAHRLVSAAGIRVPKARVLSRNFFRQENADLRENIDSDSLRTQADEIGYPLFVKPVRAGSSFGITRVTDAAALPDAVEKALQYDDSVILEEAIPGFEVGCAVLGNDRLTLGGPDEIELSEGFFDYTEKYTLKTSAIHVPARIDADKALQIRQNAARIYRTLGCRGFARVDMFLTPSGEIVFNEVNTIPGFTDHSRFPNMLKAEGLTFEEIITETIELALESDYEQY
ncbi:MAG: D-alanine--D-serine ligase VanG [Acetatifactor muris]|nr:D-alanine--D-serine ligase VanG [Acetatifactor muris]MCM1525711.1 D-alanine--D-serine ligase VanG [Bacteroides sp.]